MNGREKKALPTVYSCSGCSSAAQMANHIALKLDRLGLAEMSCIAGVGGNVKSLVNKARSSSYIIGIDGCGLSCVKACLLQHGLAPDQHVDLSQMGVRKQAHHDFSTAEAEQILTEIAADLKNWPHRQLTSQHE